MTPAGSPPPATAPEEDDPLRVDTVARKEQIDAAHQVPGHPAHQAIAEEMELHAGVVAEVVILAARSIGFGIVFGAMERMRPAFAVADLVDDEDEAASPCPGHAHVLQLAIAFVAVMGMGDQDARHRLAWFSRDVQVARHPLAGPALVDQVLDGKAVAVYGARCADVELGRRQGIFAQRLAQVLDPLVTEFFPLFARFYFGPFLAVTGVNQGGAVPMSR